MKWFEWGSNGNSIIFYTNNPFDFSDGASSINRMKFFQTRRLHKEKEDEYQEDIFEEKTVKEQTTFIEEETKKTGRILAGGNNFQIDANFSLSMSSTAVISTFPFVTQNNLLTLSYNINQP